MTHRWQTGGDAMRTAMGPQWRAALISGALFWAFYFIVATGRAFFVGFEDPVAMIPRRATVVAIGLVITLLLVLMMRPLERLGVGWRMIAYLVAAIPASAAYSAVNYAIFYIISPMDFIEQSPDEKGMSFVEIVIASSFGWYWFFVAWAAFYLALRYAHDARISERRIAAWRAEAQSAQIRALRYQVNPHFLFNTLNSLSAMILGTRTDEAERMLLNLSAFLRATLSGDPEEPIPLEEEVDQQRLYLEIEKVRFGDRLRFDIDLGPGTRGIRVPPMILQPIIENAVRYAVSPSKEPVDISLSSRLREGRLHIVVRDTGPGNVLDSGLGTGLRNVRARLDAAYGDAAEVIARAAHPQGFLVELSWPPEIPAGARP